MRTCLSRNTLESGGFSGNGPENVTFQLGEPSWEGEGIIVPVTGTPNPPAPDAEPPPEAFPSPAPLQLTAILVREEGEGGGWKLDLAATMDRMMGGSMEQTMNQLADTMSQAVGAIGSAFSEGMQQAFGSAESDSESSSSPIPDWNLVPLVPCVDEVLPLPEMESLPKLAAALSEALGSEIVAQAAMTDLLRQVASDQHEVLLNWFEDQLFANWGSLLARVHDQQSLAGRLRAVRIEAASYHEHRFIALDGNDLVYRIYINDPAGYYSDEELGRILPGVLAGLPQEMVPGLANHRFLPNDEEWPSSDIYRERIVPRYMRRISQLLEKPLRLEADFDEVYDTQAAARQLSRWGINRVYGALALACQDYDVKHRLWQELHTVKLCMGHDDRQRWARYEGGILEVGQRSHEGEKGSFYEHELVAAILGSPILGEGQEEAQAEESLGLAEESQESQPDNQAASDPSGFESAVNSLRENGEPAWRQQLEMTFGRPIGLSLDYDALHGDAERIQPFIHQSLSGGIGALSMLAFDPEVRPKLAPVEHVTITLPVGGGEDGPTVSLTGNTLTIGVSPAGEGPPPIQEIASAIRAAFDIAPASTVRADDAMAVDDSPPDGEDFQTTPPGEGDRYQQAGNYMDQLEAVMRRENIWPGDKPDGPLEVKGAFGSENMPFEHWLAWVLIPRVRGIIEEQGSFPGGSQVAAYAVRAFDGHPSAGPVIDLLAQFDQFVTDLASR
jgi:uncharacterized protein YqcC (DUF446 family)